MALHLGLSRLPGVMLTCCLTAHSGFTCLVCCSPEDTGLSLGWCCQEIWLCSYWVLKRATYSHFCYLALEIPESQRSLVRSPKGTAGAYDNRLIDCQQAPSLFLLNRNPAHTVNSISPCPASVSLRSALVPRPLVAKMSISKLQASRMSPMLKSP